MEKTLLESLVVQHKSIREICRETGQGYSTVRHWLKRHGLKTDTKYGKSIKVCIKCKEEKDLYSNKYCKDCDRRRIVELGNRNKQKAIEYKGGQCKECGYKKCIQALEFHHLDPTKKDATFSSMKYWCWERIKKELDKCDLVCSNCHREIHAKERGEFVV